VALAAGAKEGIWIRQFLKELGIQQNYPTDIFVDNISAIKLAQNPEFHQRSKHIDVRLHFTRSLIEDQQIQVSYVPSSEQLADILTKPLLKTKHEEMRNEIGMKSKQSQGGYLMKKSYALLSLLVTASLALVIYPAQRINVQNSQPLLWREFDPSDHWITKSFLKVKLMDPCDLLTSDILHTDVAKIAQIRCREMYKEHFLYEMREMCPVDYGYEVVHTRSKRFIFNISIIITSSLVLWAGNGTALGLSIYNTAKVSDLQSIANSQAELLSNLEQRVNATEIAIRKGF